MKEKVKLYTLDQLVTELSQQLQNQNLTLPDRRAAPLPDARSIRYYTSLGLVDPPLIKNRRAHYQERHLEQVLLIKALQSKGLSLQAIQKQLYGLTALECQQMLKQLQAEPKAVQLPAATQWQEYRLSPGLRLQVSDDFSDADLEQSLQTIEAILKTRGKS